MILKILRVALLSMAALQLSSCSLPEPANSIPVVLDSHADTREKWAAKELSAFLGEIYVNNRFPVRYEVPDGGDYILLSSHPDHPLVAGHVAPSALKKEGAFVVTHFESAGRRVGIICGKSSRAVLDGVYSLLEQRLGYGFYLYRNAHENADDRDFTFRDWELKGEPLVGERVIFNWYNFLSGVSTWNLPDYKNWIRQAARMRHTDVMLHAYGWAPFTEFTHNGVTKPVEYLQNTAYGNHWGVVHTPDVRELIGGDMFADEGPIFGADVGKIGHGGITEANRVSKAKAMLREVIDYAANTVGLEFNWAFDVDTTYGNPQNIIRTLPRSARFPVGEHWLARPDTEAGYEFFRAMIQTTMEDYPAITKITLWSRNSRSDSFGGLTTGMTRDDLPDEWKALYDKAPPDAQTPYSAGHIYHAKVAEAFRRALDELGHPDVKLGFGSWWREAPEGGMLSDNFTPANYFMPPELTCYPLDYYMAFGRNASFREQLAGIAAKRDLVPIQWAHHDDGGHLGRPYQPPVDFADKLEAVGAQGFGVIHWMTRPLDLFFKNLQNQVWSNSLNEDLETSCRKMALDFFGDSQSAIMSEYLYEWMTTGPRFGRETGPDLGGESSTGRNSHVENFDARARDCDRRIAILDRVETSELSEEAKEAWRYFRGHEEWIKLFHLAQKDGGPDLRKEAIRKYAEKASHDGGMTRGEKGILIQHNLKWLKE